MTQKEIEKAAMLAASRYDNPLDEPCYDKHFYDGFISGVEYAIHNQWINVEDRLPENTDYVLVHVPQRILPAYCEVANWDNEDWYTQDGELIRPDFWLPIPQLNPEKEER